MPSSACALPIRSEEHTSELQSHLNLVCRLLLDKKARTSLTYTLRPNHDRRVVAIQSTHAHISARSDDRGVVVRPPPVPPRSLAVAFFFKDTAPTEIYTLPLHDALPIFLASAANSFAPQLTKWMAPSSTADTRT